MSSGPQHPIHGTRLEKDAPAEAVQDALRLLYTVNLIAKTAGVPVFGMKRAVPGGEVTASVNGALAFKSVRVSPPARETVDIDEEVRLAWMPEGFVITPRTEGAPEGFGMPPTQDGRGTPGGALRQVIINRFKHNQYPDALYAAQGAGYARVNCANLFFMDWEREPDPAKKPKQSQQEAFSIGMDGVPQFDPEGASRWSQKLKEPDGGKWFCHRPMHAVGYEDEVRKKIRDETNLVRESSGGKKPLAPPLRGKEGELSANILYQMSYAHLQEHDSDAYLAGHRKFPQRLNDRSGVHSLGGENLFSSSKDLGLDFAHEAVSWWSQSPGHFANMVDDWDKADWVYDGNNALHATLDVAVAAELELTAMSPSINPATAAAQIFVGHRSWVDPGVVSGDGHKTSAIAPHATVQGHGYFPLEVTNFLTPGVLRGEDGFGPEVSDGRALPPGKLRHPLFFSVHGRLGQLRTNADPYMMLLAGTVVRNGNHHALRVCVAESPDPSILGTAKRRVDLVIYEGHAGDYLQTRVELSRFALPALCADISAPKFSASGDKLVFSYAVMGVADSAFRDRREGQNTVLTPPPGSAWNTASSFVWGDTLHFMEWKKGAAGGVFSEVSTDSLSVNVEFSSRAPFEGWLEELETCTATCVGECRYLADYDKDDKLVYARLQVNCKSEFRSGTSETTTGPTHKGYLYGQLRFPNGETLVFQNLQTQSAEQTSAGEWHVGEESGAKGFFLQLMYLNILQPHLNTYVQQNVRETLRPVSDSSFSGVTKQARAATSLWSGNDLLAEYGDSLKQGESPAQDHALIGPTPFGAYDMTQATDEVDTQPTFLPFIYAYNLGPGGDPILGGGSARRMPVRAFKAAIVSPAAHSYVDEATLQGGSAYRWVSGLGGIGMDAMYCVGPTVLNPIIGSRVHRTEVCTYKDDFIIAGEIRRTIGKRENHANGMEKFFHCSSLDLKAITGFDDLKQNILPIGVIR